MPSEFKFNAKDRKGGMTLPELEEAISYIGAGGKYRLKARVGFGNQLQELIFVEVDDEASAPA